MSGVRVLYQRCAASDVHTSELQRLGGVLQDAGIKVGWSGHDAC